MPGKQLPENATISPILMPNPTAEKSLTLEIDRDGDTAIVRCTGRLIAGVSDFFYNKVKQLMPDHKRIVLDFTNLAQVDSMGIGSLVRLYVSAKSAGCELQLVNLGKRLRELLGITNLLSVFTICGESDIRIP
jgi:anti-sigma B factor antagonist